MVVYIKPFPLAHIEMYVQYIVIILVANKFYYVPVVIVATIDAGLAGETGQGRVQRPSALAAPETLAVPRSLHGHKVIAVRDFEAASTAQRGRRMIATADEATQCSAGRGRRGRYRVGQQLMHAAGRFVLYGDRGGLLIVTDTFGRHNRHGGRLLN